MEKAIFAAGCFWGVQHYFDQVPGVIETTVGYTGGHVENPTYEQVCAQNTGHTEAVLIEFEPEVVTYKILLRHFFTIHDPTQLNRQGLDVGNNYRSAIYYTSETQRRNAEKVRDLVQKGLKRPVVTQIETERPFYKAENYHQKYAERMGRGVCPVAYRPLEE